MTNRNQLLAKIAKKYGTPTYAYDPDLGFLGGPYVPLVTVEVEGLTFEFISYLGALFTVTAGDNPDWSANGIAFPSLSVSMPAEDLCIPALDTGSGSNNCRYGGST